MSKLRFGQCNAGDSRLNLKGPKFFDLRLIWQGEVVLVDDKLYDRFFFEPSLPSLILFNWNADSILEKKYKIVQRTKNW